MAIYVQKSDIFSCFHPPLTCFSQPQHTCHTNMNFLSHDVRKLWVKTDFGTLQWQISHTYPRLIRNCRGFAWMKPWGAFMSEWLNVVLFTERWTYYGYLSHICKGQKWSIYQQKQTFTMSWQRMNALIRVLPKDTGHQTANPVFSTQPDFLPKPQQQVYYINLKKKGNVFASYLCLKATKKEKNK